MTDDVEKQLTRDEAVDNISRAIQAYYDVVTPDEYVTAWVVVSERTSIEHVKQHNGYVAGVVTKQDQSFISTRGLLDVALTSERQPRRG